MSERYERNAHLFTAGPVKIEITDRGLKLIAAEPAEVFLPWDDGGIELAGWLGRLVE